MMSSQVQRLGLMGRLNDILRITLVERRIPGRCYQAFYNVLDRLGVRIATVRVGRGVRLRGFTRELSMAQEIWSKRVYDQPEFTFSPGQVVIDVGANQGFFSLYAASLGATVYAFEPCRENFNHLRQNLRMNPCGERVQPFNRAVAGKSGRVTLFVGLDSANEILSGTASICNTRRGGVGVRSEAVDGTTLNEILREHDLTRCDFLKMDCEGAEYEILESTSADVFSRIQRISMETHGGRGQEAVDILKSRGYEIIEYENAQAGFIKARRTGLAAS
jgi:FkbM family methyltransferase